MDINKLGFKATWQYPNEEAPRSILGYLALDNKHYTFYPLNKEGKLEETPLKTSFYEEGAEELTRNIVKGYGCTSIKKEDLPKTHPNIRLICYPNKGTLEVVYGLNLLDNSYLPKEQTNQLLKVIEKRNPKAPHKLENNKIDITI